MFQRSLEHSECELVKYERIHATLEAKRLSSQFSYQKVQKILGAAQINKERNFLRLHKQVWLQEHHRLNIARHKTENDFQCFLHGSGLEEEDNILSQLLKCELDREQEREEFWLTTVEPMYQLRDELQYRLTPHCSTSNNTVELENILQQVVSVRHQQKEVMDRLQCECVSLQQDIHATELKKHPLVTAVDHSSYLEKVPEEIFNADCPHPDLRSEIIHSFHSLTGKYKLRLAMVESRLLGLDRNCGWNAEDHEFFLYIMSLYTPSQKKKCSLYFDMVQRAFPHITQKELREHGRRNDWYHFSLTQKNLVLQGWKRDHSELLLRALSMLDDYRISHKQQQELQIQRLHQQTICLKLREKLQQWRIQQEEAAELEAALAAYWHNEEEERLKKEQQKEKYRRAQLSQQIKRFNAEKQKRREEQRKRDLERLSELRRKMEEQIQRDKERVNCRKELFQQKLQMREAKHKEKQKDDKKREERLQALCSQVSKVAEVNPERMMGNTVAWTVRQHPEEAFSLQRPLYQLNTYSDKQIVSDPRVRFEQALRSAGLHKTPYARQILSGIQPLKPPRRDMESTTFRS